MKKRRIISLVYLREEMRKLSQAGVKTYNVAAFMDVYDELETNRRFRYTRDSIRAAAAAIVAKGTYKGGAANLLVKEVK